MKKISINHLKFANNVWLRGLAFYKLEIELMQERIEEIASNNTSKKAMIKLEYFQNQVIIHREQLDMLKHRVHELEKLVERDLIVTPSFVSRPVTDEASRLADDYMNEEKMANDLRHAFNRYAAEWL